MWRAVLLEAGGPWADEEWSGDEVFLFLISSVICLMGVGRYLTRVATVTKLGCPAACRLPLYGAFACGSAGLLGAACRWASKEVRANGGYLLLTMIMGGAALTLAAWCFRWLGISLREDGFERRNLAAVWALAGATAGVLVIYAGANMGEGPSFWNNVFSAVLGLVVWFALWFGLQLSADVSRSIVEERDIASGVRLASFLLAQGLLLGRALAGDWTSAEATERDFWRTGWPALVLLAVAALVERTLRPSVTCPVPSWKTRGLPAAMLYLVGALVWVWHLGWWQGAPL